jgi:hypothetical protein
MTPPTLSDRKVIIEKLEAATEGSRELDALIWTQILPKSGMGLDGYMRIESATFEYEAGKNGYVHQWVCNNGERLTGPLRPAPHYTTSLDAALQLVPYEADWDCGFIRENKAYTANIMLPMTAEQMKERFPDWPEGAGYSTEHAKARTPALALCIAALKARP